MSELRKTARPEMTFAEAKALCLRADWSWADRTVPNGHVLCGIEKFKCVGMNSGWGVMAVNRLGERRAIRTWEEFVQFSADSVGT